MLMWFTAEAPFPDKVRPEAKSSTPGLSLRRGFDTGQEPSFGFQAAIDYIPDLAIRLSFIYAVYAVPSMTPFASGARWSIQ